MNAQREQPGTAGSRLATTFRALRYRNYRLYFLGQGVSLLGTWMQMLAVTWLVYRLTNSPGMLGMVGFAGQIPTFLIASFAGVMADRTSKRRLLVGTQAAAMLQALLLGVLTLGGGIVVWHLIVLSVMLGIVNAFDTPARQSFVVDLVESKNDLGNAIALNSSLFNGARLVGPSVAGLLIAVVGEGWCFMINAVSFLAVILALLAMRLDEPVRPAAHESMLRGWVAGLRYVRSSPVIRPVLLLIAVASAVGMPYMVLMPVFARDVLGGGPHTLGFLMASAGLGALAGALFLASRTSTRGLRESIPVTGAIFGAGLVAFDAMAVLQILHKYSNNFLFSLSSDARNR